jgi:Cu/Ag efflux pump CusA
MQCPLRRRGPNERVVARLIRGSSGNPLLVALATTLLGVWGVVALVRTPLDAIPDLSDVQVTIRTTFPGQAPQIVENQVTYPLRAVLRAPNATLFVALVIAASALWPASRIDSSRRCWVG